MLLIIIITNDKTKVPVQLHVQISAYLTSDKNLMTPRSKKYHLFHSHDECHCSSTVTDCLHLYQVYICELNTSYYSSLDHKLSPTLHYMYVLHLAFHHTRRRDVAPIFPYPFFVLSPASLREELPISSRKC